MPGLLAIASVRLVAWAWFSTAVAPSVLARWCVARQRCVHTQRGKRRQNMTALYLRYVRALRMLSAANMVIRSRVSVTIIHMLREWDFDDPDDRIANCVALPRFCINHVSPF